MLRLTTHQVVVVTTIAACVWLFVPTAKDTADAGQKDRIRYQQPQELFYNHYVGPGPRGVPAKAYVSPLPVPASVGHTYYTYPPFYPHEMMYSHQRAWYTYHSGAGWTRTKANYSTRGGLLDLWSHMRRF